MRKPFIITGSLLIIFFTGCSPSRDKSVENIKNLEQILFSPQTVSLDKKKSDSLISMYEGFLKRFPHDSLAPKFAFQAGSIAMNTGDGAKALTLFDLILDKYPDYRKTPLCLFFKGFIYENLLQNLDKSREVYQEFIEKYPNDEFIPSARASIRNLGKTPDQMVREFEAKHNADSTRKADSINNLKSKKRK